ncbi:plancitoxin-1-like [Boleophthalmus pectinirostris]|uniref:plancitoxin-1-like n=1 Tax=Boleophthalmus pectinirostris TaxID=150288 RepID=UPI002433307F|nr:plancitoxin-1-like [Boleophthalmus pectinirostris]
MSQTNGEKLRCSSNGLRGGRSLHWARSHIYISADLHPLHHSESDSSELTEEASIMWWVPVSVFLLWSSEVSALGAPVSVSCKNDNNGDVDWYVLYKAPGTEQRTGTEYIYIDSAGQKTNSHINDANGPLANTLRPMLGSVRTMPSTFGFLSYSDQPPGAQAMSELFGHSKGVVMGDSSTQTALWITHSTPRFPFRRDQNRFWPDSGKDKGQTFLCVSLPFSALKTVGEHLQRIHAYPYDYDLPGDFPSELEKAARWETSATGLGTLVPLQTIGHKDLAIMAKPLGEEAKDGDLYVKLADQLNSNVKAQTWACQPKRDESFCDRGKKQVINVEAIDTKDDTMKKWSSKIDHSKWAVTTESNIIWTCFGDMNRASTQYERWGGAVCIKDKNVNTAFKQYPSETLSCGKRPYPC